MDDMIRNRIMEVFGTLDIPTDGITDETNLGDDLEVDSTEMVEVVVMLESEFGSKFEAGTEKAKTFGALVATVREQLEKAGVADAAH